MLNLAKKQYIVENSTFEEALEEVFDFLYKDSFIIVKDFVMEGGICKCRVILTNKTKLIKLLVEDIPNYTFNEIRKITILQEIKL